MCPPHTPFPSRTTSFSANPAVWLSGMYVSQRLNFFISKSGEQLQPCLPPECSLAQLGGGGPKWAARGRDRGARQPMLGPEPSELGTPQGRTGMVVPCGPLAPRLPLCASLYRHGSPKAAGLLSLDTPCRLHSRDGLLLIWGFPILVRAAGLVDVSVCGCGVCSVCVCVLARAAVTGFCRLPA